MTQDEAKTKWCPFARVGYTNGDLSSATPNRLTEGSVTESLNGANLCIASACMAWRAKTRIEQRDRRDRLPVQPGTIYLRGNIESFEVPDGGYCGLAGEPQ